LRTGDLTSRLWFTLGALVIYHLGRHLPLPGVEALLADSAVVNERRIAPFSIFAVGIWPYVTASFWLLLLNAAWRWLRRRKDLLPSRQKGLDRAARFAALLMAASQGYAIALTLEHLKPFGIASGADPGPRFELTAALTVAAGAGISIWLADQITRKGLGNGVGLILLSDFAGLLPRSFSTLLEQARMGVISTTVLVLLIALVVLIVAGVVFMESARRLVSVHYAPRRVGAVAFPGAHATLRLKLNNFGIQPLFFASSLLLYTVTLSAFDGGRTGWLAELGSSRRPASLALYALFIVALAAGYRMVILNPREMANALRVYGGTISDRELGAPTAEYLGHLLRRLTAIGAVYVATLCLLPEILISRFGVYFDFTASSLLLVVCISLDLVTALRARSRPDASS
jgi:preprotein translocase subunit SecY